MAGPESSAPLPACDESESDSEEVEEKMFESYLYFFSVGCRRPVQRVDPSIFFGIASSMARSSFASQGKILEASGLAVRRMLACRQGFYLAEAVPNSRCLDIRADWKELGAMTPDASCLGCIELHWVYNVTAACAVLSRPALFYRPWRNSSRRQGGWREFGGGRLSWALAEWTGGQLIRGRISPRWRTFPGPTTHQSRRPEPAGPSSVRRLLAHFRRGTLLLVSSCGCRASCRGSPLWQLYSCSASVASYSVAGFLV